MGRRRRNLLRDRGGAAFRRGSRRLNRTARGTAAGAYGLSQKAIHLIPRERAPLDDITLARKVESILYRDPELPKGRLNISAREGMVELRGELDHPEEIRTVEAMVRRVPGVRRVNNLLHLPGTVAPNKEPAWRAS
jgi:osmotically-inducible protein OsmY